MEYLLQRDGCYNGKERIKCTAINKAGDTCGNIAKYKGDGTYLCFTHYRIITGKVTTCCTCSQTGIWEDKGEWYCTRHWTLYKKIGVELFNKYIELRNLKKGIIQQIKEIDNLLYLQMLV